jgi:opine dehydrogenase
MNKVSTNIDEVMSDIIFVTTPSIAHNDIAELIANKVTDKNIIILSPGRTFGAITFEKNLINNGCKSIPHILETQTIIHTCRKTTTDSVHIFALKKDVLISSLNTEGISDLIKTFPLCISKYLKEANSIIETSLGNIGMILHCAPTLMNIGSIESERVSFKYYFDGISKSVAKFLEKLDFERLMVAKEMGISLESSTDWMKRTYGTHGTNLYECIRNNVSYHDIDAPATIDHRYLNEDVPNGLVPLEFLATSCGIDVPNTKLVIDLANAIMGIDYRRIGRKISKFELESYLKSN